MAEHFLTKSRIDLSRCITVANTAAVEQHAEMTAALAAKAGPDAAKLFAEPLINRGNDQAASTISWYCDRVGQGTQFSKLDGAAQAEVRANLSAILTQIEPLMDDAEVGPLVCSAMHIASAASIWAVDGHPVLINWGLLPEDGASDGTARMAQYNKTLGPFLPLTAAPPLSDSEIAQRQEDQAKKAPLAPAAAVAGAAIAAGAVAASASPAAAAIPPQGAGMTQTGVAPSGADAAGGVPPGATPPGAVPPAPEPREPRGRVPLLAWLPLALMILLFGGILIWLLIPGNRIFADDGVRPVITDEAAIAAARQTNRDLEQRLADLRGALDGAVCRADGTLLMPNGATLEGLTPPNDQGAGVRGNDQGGQVVEGDQRPVLPPAKERVVVPNQNGELSDTANLLNHIDERTAMVLAQSGEGLSTGTGFFVGPDLLVTNHHVIDGAGSEDIFVTNKSLGGLKKVELLKSFGPMETVGGDFALLRVIGVNQPAFDIRRNDQSMRLQSVIAAGYPGDVLRTDDQFAALREGNLTAVPELTVTDGTVNTEQSLSDVTHAVVHSAPISTGNSGGPLIDMCGRVIGVNTFVIQGPMRNLNFALATQDLLTFLGGTAAVPSIDREDCRPMVARPQRVTEAEVAPEPDAAPEPEAVGE